MKQVLLLVVVCAVTAITPFGAAGEVTARNPLIAPLFTIDEFSPEVIGGFLDPGDLLLPTGPSMPSIEVPRMNLGLLTVADNVDALALSETDLGGTDTFVIIFSVDRAATGGALPDPNVAALGFPFNVRDQASKNQAASDAFMSLLLFDRSGPIPPNNFPVRGSTSANNVLVINGGDAGGVDFYVTPTDSPATNNSGSQSNVNGGSGTQPSSKSTTGLRAAGGWPQGFAFFSLGAGSPSLGALPGTGSPADIYIDTDLDTPFGQELYVGPNLIGLLPGDDIDGLIIFENGDNAFTSGADQLIFSLAPGSPSLDGNWGSGDLFTSVGFGSFQPFCTASNLGLAETDNLNMLDFVPCADVVTCANDWAIGYIDPCPWDLDDDGDVDLADLAALLSVYGSCFGDPAYNPEADFNHNGCIGLSDLSVLLSNYGGPC